MANKKKEAHIEVPDFSIEDEAPPAPEEITNIEVGADSRTPAKPRSDKEWWEQTDQTLVEDKTEGYNYRWVTQKNIQKRKRMGYEIVPKNSQEHIPCGDESSKSGKTMGGGDLVLMKAPDKKVDKYREHLTKQSMQRAADQRRRAGAGPDFGKPIHANKLK